MDFVVFTLHPLSLVAIAVMVSVLVVAYLKKITMTYALIIGNFVVFFLTLIAFNEVINDLGFRPIYLTLEYSPQLYTLFTSMFLHGGLAHIIGNMLVFFFMGIAFEQRIGWKKFLTIYLLTGVFAALTHALFNLGSRTPLIGASGAVFGILGAFALSYPRDEVVLPLPLFFIMIFRRMKVMYAAILFAAFETIIVWFDVQDTTAHLAHLGGLISGGLLAVILIRSGNRPGRRASSDTIYYDSYGSDRARNYHFGNLTQLAQTPEQQELLDRIKQESIPQIQDAWLERFLEHARCPKCGELVHSFHGKIWCDNCGFKTKY